MSSDVCMNTQTLIDETYTDRGDHLVRSVEAKARLDVGEDTRYYALPLSARSHRHLDPRDKHEFCKFCEAD